MPKTKSICLTINSLNRGGAEKQCLLLAKALKEHHKVILVVMNSKPIYPPRMETIRREKIEYVFLPDNIFNKILFFTKLLRKRQVEMTFSFLPTDTIITAICGKLARVNYIFGGIRNSFIPRFKFRMLKMIHNLLLDYTIANNYAAHTAATEFGFKKTVFVVPNGIEIESGNKPVERNNKPITIISLGRLVEQKDYITALKSISRLKNLLDENIRIRYKIVGQGPEQESILQNIERLNLSEEVELVLNPTDINGLLNEADMYLCTSTFEGISNAILEAMMHSLPVVATDAGDNRHLVINTKNGFIVPLYDVERLAEHLYYLITSPKERVQMGMESYNHLTANFGYEVFKKKYLDIINDVEKLCITESGDIQFNNVETL